jgi:hypothetical protein
VRAASCHALGSTRKRKRVTTQVVLLFVVHSESALALDMTPPFRANALIFPVSSIVADFANGWRPFVPASRCQS